ncbi:30S ribosomal protein S9 [Candidatus Gracilibacteria bacterium]|nr:30S ribosomal protein S9 [Candidatus Gracilibacteria bacterium]
MVNKAYFYAIGKRKTSRATVKLFPGGKGELSVNEQKLREWADDNSMVKTIHEPLDLLGLKKDFDIEIRVSGGGKKAQAESARLAISRAIIKKESSLREQLREAGLLTRDPRVKERKKPGLKSARRAPQWSKR